MAEHFEEVVNLRLRALETRVNEEVGAVEKHFAELRVFITESLNTQLAQLRAGLRSEFYSEIGGLRSEFHSEIGGLRSEIRSELGRVRADVGRIEQRLGNFQETTRLEFGRLEQRMDAHHQATHLVLQDILRRLPAASA